MKWKEVRKLYPNQFVKVQILNSHIEDDEEFVDDMAVIGSVDNSKPTEELFKAKEDILIYHTSKEEVVLIVRKRKVATKEEVDRLYG